MKQLLDIRGIITVLNTPFTSDNRIDIPSLRKNVNMAIDAGVAGFLVPAMAAEVSKLNVKEREQIVGAVLEEATGRTPVIGGASARDETERKHIAKGLIDMGCDGILVNLPHVESMAGNQAYENSVKSIAALDPGFLMLQDWAPSGFGLPLSLIEHLFEEIDAFRALKVEVVPSGYKYSRVLDVTAGRLHVSGGWAVMQLIESLDRGVHAFMPTGMHAIYTAIYNRYQEGDRTGAESLFNKLLPVLAFSNQHLDISVHFFKRLLHGQGIYSTPRVRKPILEFDEVHEMLASKHVKLVKELTRQLDG
ncbi:dihydrodipicolinate synthase family protein [Candidatus Bathyarchaeota archaeon]|nr:dihydrodipicolinate synthase family protein [Candidatus Bathyarchaeota archaeon]